MSNILNPDRESQEEISNLVRARKAAMEFCRKFGFPKEKLDELLGLPLDGPLLLERNGKQMEVFRWLGHGRGDYIVQCEIELTSGKVTVFGGFGHKEFGPWSPP